MCPLLVTYRIQLYEIFRKMTATSLLHAKKELIYGYTGGAQDGLMDVLLCGSMPTE